MRRALQARPATVPIASTVTLPAPTGGMNTRDALSMMPISDAEIMDNWFPEPSFVRTRKGSDTWFTATGNVETVMNYGGASSLTLLIASGEYVYNATYTGSASASALLLSGRVSGRWQHTNFDTPGGNFLVACNGEERPIFYNGTTLTAMTSLTAKSGNVANFIDVHAFAQRLIFIEKDSMNFHYVEAVEAVGGTAAKYPLGSIFNHGGQLMCVDSWTRDGGDGMDDACVFITSQGEVAVYTGTDPSSANTWALQGVYRIPKPLSRRCTEKFGGDLLVLTESGIYPMSVVLSGIEPQTLVTDKINDQLVDEVKSHRDNWGWELRYFPAGHWLIINVPHATNSDQKQYIMNTITGAWCRFTGLEANTWETFNSKIYFGSAAALIEANTGDNDNGTDIQVDVKQAPTNYQDARRKRFTLIRPFINSTNSLPVAIGMNFDFGNRFPTSIPAPAGTSIPYWGIATWSDPSYYWAGAAVPIGTIVTAGGAGIYAAMRIRGAVNGDELEWNATQVTYERGAYV